MHDLVEHIHRLQLDLRHRPSHHVSAKLEILAKIAHGHLALMIAEDRRQRRLVTTEMRVVHRTVEGRQILRIAGQHLVIERARRDQAADAAGLGLADAQQPDHVRRVRVIGKIGVGLVDTGLPVLEIADIHHPSDQVSGRVLAHRNAHMQAEPVIEDVDRLVVKSLDRHAAHENEPPAALQLVAPGAELRAEGGKREILDREIREGLAGRLHCGNGLFQLVALRGRQRPDPAVVTLEIRPFPDTGPCQLLGMNDPHQALPLPFDLTDPAGEARGGLHQHACIGLLR